MLVQQTTLANGETGRVSVLTNTNPWSLAIATLAAQARRYVLLIVATSLLFGLAAASVRLFIPKSYKATVQILIDPRGFRVFSNDLQSSQLDANTEINFVESQMGVIRSERVLLRVIREQRALNPATNTELDEVDESRALAQLQRAITVQRVERRFIVDVTVADRSPSRAATLANAIVKAYMDEDALDRGDSVKRLTDELTNRLDGLRRNFREAEERVQTFRAKNGLVGVQDKLVIEQRLTEATTSLSLAESREAQFRGKLAQLASPSNQMSSIGALGTDPDSRSLILLLEAQATAQNDLGQLSGTLGEQHPSLVNARNRLKEIDKGIATAVAGMRKSTQSQLEQIQTELSYLSRRVAELSADLSKAREAEVGLRMLQSDAEAHRKVLESFETRSREAREFGQIDRTNLRIISPARMPTDQSYVFVVLSWGLVGMMIGVTLSMGAIGFAAIFMHGNHGAEQQQEIPIADQGPHRAAGIDPASRPSEKSSDLTKRNVSGSAANASIHSVLKSCLSIGNFGFSRKTCISILVTSLEAGGNHTGVAINLASLAAASGRRVLLVDADQAGPSLSSMMPPGGPENVIILAGILRPLYRLQTGSNSISVVPITENQQDVCLRIALRGGDHPVVGEFDFVVYVGPGLRDSERLKELARNADRVVLVAGTGNSATQSAEEVAGRIGIPAGRILNAAYEPADLDQAA